MYLRLFICFVIVAGAFVLKTTNAPILTEISKKVSEEMQIESAIEALGSGFFESEGVKAVFEEEKQEAQLDVETETPSFEDFYIGEHKKELDDARLRMQEEEKKLSVETLSFQMSAEELSDDTAAEPFRIPPPSYCSYDKTKIAFQYTTPLCGVITSRFGYRDHPIIEDASFHTGLDIAAKHGSAIVAFASGKVIESGVNATYGKYLLIEHADGIRSFYGHNSKLCVKKGQNVKMGQKVSEVGSTGMSTGPHLHFEVRRGGIRLDPALYITAERV